MDVILLKAVGASLAFLLAVLNLLIMLQLYGKISLFPWASEPLAWWHRRQGDVILVFFVLIAYHCVRYGDELERDDGQREAAEDGGAEPPGRTPGAVPPSPAAPRWPSPRSSSSPCAGFPS